MSISVSAASARQLLRLMPIACVLLYAALLCLPFAEPSLAADSGGKDGNSDDNYANAYIGTDSDGNYASSNAHVRIDTGGSGKDIYGGFSISGDSTGNTVTMTGGEARRLSGLYTEGSFRLGYIENQWKSHELMDAAGRRASYDTSASYYGAPLRTGLHPALGGKHFS